MPSPPRFATQATQPRVRIARKGSDPFVSYVLLTFFEFWSPTPRKCSIGERQPLWPSAFNISSRTSPTLVNSAPHQYRLGNSDCLAVAAIAIFKKLALVYIWQATGSVDGLNGCRYSERAGLCRGISASPALRVSYQNRRHPMGEIFRLHHVHSYPQEKIGWYIYDLLCYPMPVAAIRNLNDHDETRDKTFSWKKDSNLKTAIRLTCDLLKAWQAFRSGVPGVQEQLIPSLQDKLPNILLTFQREAKDLGVRRILDVKPHDPWYSKLLLAMARAVDEIAKLKHVDNPMLGSKVMHFLFPEFFPVWDTEWIKNKCLARERHKLNKTVRNRITSRAGRDYAVYVDLMVTDLAQTPDYAVIKKACLQLAWMGDEVADWFYDDIAPTVFEICLLGKHVKRAR